MFHSTLVVVGEAAAGTHPRTAAAAVSAAALQVRMLFRGEAGYVTHLMYNIGYKHGQQAAPSSGTGRESSMDNAPHVATGLEVRQWQ